MGQHPRDPLVIHGGSDDKYLGWVYLHMNVYVVDTQDTYITSTDLLVSFYSHPSLDLL